MTFDSWPRAHWISLPTIRTVVWSWRLAMHGCVGMLCRRRRGRCSRAGARWAAVGATHSAPRRRCCKCCQADSARRLRRRYCICFRSRTVRCTPIARPYGEPPADRLVRKGTPADSNDTGALLYRDAVYAAIGLCAYDLYETLDFAAWLRDHLLADLQQTHPMCVRPHASSVMARDAADAVCVGGRYKVIRRRIAWLLQHWAPLLANDALWASIYRILVTLMQPQDGVSVRLAAACALRDDIRSAICPCGRRVDLPRRRCGLDACCALIECHRYVVQDFLPCFAAASEALLGLFSAIRDADAQLVVVSVLAAMIESVDTDVQPYAAALLKVVPSLWRASEHASLVRCAIVRMLAHLLHGLREHASMAYGVVLPIVLYATDASEVRVRRTGDRVPIPARTPKGPAHALCGSNAAGTCVLVRRCARSVAGLCARLCNGRAGGRGTSARARTAPDSAA